MFVSEDCRLPGHALRRSTTPEYETFSALTEWAVDGWKSVSRKSWTSTADEPGRGHCLPGTGMVSDFVAE